MIMGEDELTTGTIENDHDPEEDELCPPEEFYALDQMAEDGEEVER
jgi:hypothetical protein